MSDDRRRPWRFYLDDMMGFAEKVVAYARGFDQLNFTGGGANYDAALRNLELIGEAAIHVPNSIRADHPQIPWRLLIATRNRLIHGYLGLDDDVLWSIIQGDVPALLVELRALTAKLQ